MTDYIGNFTWFDLMTRDKNASRTFFTELFGWTVNEVPMGPMGTYDMLMNGENAFGGIVPMDEPGRPSHWMAYIGTDSVDNAVERITKMGGEVAVPATDIPNVGRFSVVSDAQGAWFSVFTPADPDGAMAVRGPVGSFNWAELATTDVDNAKIFYGENFNWSTGNTFAGDNPYHFMMRNDQPICGLYDKPADVPVSHWTHYVHVDNVEETIANAKNLGGSVIVDSTTIPDMVTFAVLSDPAGAAFGIHKPLAA